MSKVDNALEHAFKAGVSFGIEWGASTDCVRNGETDEQAKCDAWLAYAAGMGLSAASSDAGERARLREALNGLAFEVRCAREPLPRPLHQALARADAALATSTVSGETPND